MRPPLPRPMPITTASFTVHGSTYSRLEDEAAKIMLAFMDDSNTTIDLIIHSEPQVQEFSGEVVLWKGSVEARVYRKRED